MPGAVVIQHRPSRDKLMVKRSTIAGVALGAVACLGATGAARADDLSYFEGQIAPYTKMPEFVAPGPDFDAADCMKG